MRYIVATLILGTLSGVAVRGADAKAGQAAYDGACKSCHGPDGTANPTLAKMLKVEMADLKSPAVQNLSDADLKKITSEGKGKMKPISSVSGADLDNVVTYVRSLKK
jgi:predicted CXXCH cytochrome family protein